MAEIIGAIDAITFQTNLLSEIIDKVDNGFQLGNSAGKTIESVVDQARTVTDLVNNIATALLAKVDCV